jgi:hypothetical protein
MTERPISAVLEHCGWWLMGLPTGIREPWPLLLRWGPYRWGAWLANRNARYPEVMTTVERSPDSPVDLGEPPYPGSDAALDKGCICPVLDNGHGNTGLARDRGGWIIVTGCPLHAPERSISEGMET